MLIIQANAYLKITEYTDSNIITINEGSAVIQEGYFKHIHIVDISLYREYIENLTDYTNRIIPKNNTQFDLIRFELINLNELLDEIKPITRYRYKKAINFLGSIWKFIGGSPDHDDLEAINENLTKLNENNNRQIVINKSINDKINNLTKITNDLINEMKQNNFIINEIAMNIEYKIKIIKEEITNIKYAIQWAKQNIINTMILDQKEILQTMGKLKENNLLFSSYEEAIRISDIKVLYNKEKILYIISIPITNGLIFENLVIRPVKKNNQVINLTSNNVLRNNLTLYKVKTECNEVGHVKLCKKENLIDLSKEECLYRILNNLNASCTFSNGHHIKKIEEIHPGTVLLNSFDGTIQTEEARQTLNGTFIITYWNETLTINNRIFTNKEEIHVKIQSPVMQETPAEKEKIRILSLEALEELHLNNIAYIETLHKQKKIIVLSSTASILITILACAALILHIMRLSKRTTIENQKQISFEIHRLPEPEQKIKTLKITDLPHF